VVLDLARPDAPDVQVTTNRAKLPLPLYPPLLSLSHTLCQRRLKEREHLRGALRRKL
jgi:hypothetical protein